MVRVRGVWRLAGFVALLVLTAVMLAPCPGQAAETAQPARQDLPKFFSYLRAVDASIIQEIRYFGRHNFLGRRVKGYQAGECILTTRAAKALSSVQKRLLKRGLSLKVYDCYRPVRAVQDFVAWSKNKSQKTKPEFYPTLPKGRLFALGYIARRSAHSRGSTVDLAIVPLPPDKQPLFSFDEQVACFERVEERFADNSLDFGTGYDCFHALSHTLNPNIGEVARRNRALLVSEMARAGFENYSKEWWHYTLRDEPFRRKHFDFPVLPYQPLVKTKENIKAKTKAMVESPDEGQVGDAEVEEDDAPAQLEEGETDEGPALTGGKLMLNVVCVAGDDVLNVRAGPGASAAQVGSLPPDAEDVESAGCTGDLALADWHRLPLSERRQQPQPWCMVEGVGKEGARQVIKGWVSGAFVVPQGAKARACR